MQPVLSQHCYSDRKIKKEPLQAAVSSTTITFKAWQQPWLKKYSSGKGRNLISGQLHVNRGFTWFLVCT